MPRSAWTGYGRFCPLARALDVVGERWTLVIPSRPGFGESPPLERNDFEVEVLTGVAEGEEVILHPGDRVREGTMVVVG